METKKYLQRVTSHYPWDYMLFIFAAWTIPAIYGLFNRYFIGFMSYDSVVTEQSFESLEVLMEVFLEMFPLSVLALVSRDFQGQKNVRGVVKSALAMQLCITVTFSALFFVFASSFIDWINTPDSAQTLALTYFRLRVVSLPFAALTAVLLVAIKSLRRGALAVLISFIGVFFNLILDVLLISNFSFSLKLGLIGSALDNVLASIASFLVSGIAFVLVSRRSPDSPISVSNIRSVLGIGKWTGLESLVRNIGYIVGVVALVNLIGAIEPAAIGGYNTAMWVMWGITLIPILSWTEATQVAIGNAFGRKDFIAMKSIQMFSSVLMGLYMIAWIFIGHFTWEPISIWLNSGISQEVAEYSKITFNYLILPYVLFAVGSGIKSVFIGTGRPLYVLIPSAIVNMLIYIPLGLSAKYGGVVIRYESFLMVTILVFTVDFIISICYAYKKGYKPLESTDVSIT